VKTLAQLTRQRYLALAASASLPTRRDPFQEVQRPMIGEFADLHSGQQAGRGHAAVNHTAFGIGAAVTVSQPRQAY